MKKISCFSYKGGAGRTTLALNVVPFLAQKLGASPEHPLILVDMDVDSCGITYFFDLQDSENIREYCVQNLFGSSGRIPQGNGGPIQEHKLFRYLCKVGNWFNYDPAAILCLPANPGDKFGGESNYDGKQSPNLKAFITECEKNGCCGVLLDSAVGDQMVARWSNHHADTILCVMRPTKQFREGTERFFDEFDEYINDRRIIVIPNVVPTDPLTLAERDGTHAYPEFAKKAIHKAFEDNVERQDNQYDLTMVEGENFGVPKIDRFMWQEGILYTVPDRTKTEEEALTCYKKIADIICKG